jgi:UDP-N-acetylglucosamine 2-epimerase (non-hydrolysing)
VDPIVFELLKSNPRRLVLVTAHRREAFGQGMREICLAVRELATRWPKLQIVWPVHLNPNVRQPVRELLAAVAQDATRSQASTPEAESNLVLFDPLDYPTLVWLLDRSYLVLTDSGGIQEEAPSLGKPVLVLRDVTERPEGVEAGVAQLVGPHHRAIVQAVERLLSDPQQYERMSRPINPYGDGCARYRMVEALLNRHIALDSHSALFREKSLWG